VILVCGSTGDLGGAITHLLLTQNKKVRALVRPASNYPPLAEAGAELVFGDLKDRLSLDTACQGIETVLTTANSARRGGEDNPQTVDLEGNRNLIEAAKAAGVKHFFFVSALIADANSPAPFLAAKGKTEATLMASGMDYTILAPDAFMDFWIGGVVGMPALNGQPVPIVGSGEKLHSFIAARDVAQFAVAALDHPAARNQKLAVGGPQALSYLDAVKVYEKVLGRPVPVLRVQPGEPVPGLPPELWGMLAGFDMGDLWLPMEETARTYGVRLTSLEDFARGMLASAA
jgi:NADH dehydrogenase